MMINCFIYFLPRTPINKGIKLIGNLYDMISHVRVTKWPQDIKLTKGTKNVPMPGCINVASQTFINALLNNYLTFLMVL